MARQKEYSNLFLEITPFVRFLISFALAASGFFLISNNLPTLYRLMIAWIVFSCIFLLMSWIVIFLRSVTQIEKKATEDDGSTVFVFFMVVISSFADIFMVLLLLMSKDQTLSENSFFMLTSVLGIMLSWVMINTIYVFHYAHQYYNGIDAQGKRFFGGLDFPKEKEPDYLDFAYFSFVIGSTFQVSDVAITSRKIRHIALVHGVLSFLFNTFIIALMINIVAGLIK